MSWSYNSSFESSTSGDGSGSYIFRDQDQEGQVFEEFPYNRIHTTSASGTTVGSKSSKRISTFDPSEADERVLYDDPDFVTDSGDLVEPGSRNSKRERKDHRSHFDLERWWVSAPLWMRMLPFLLFLFLLIGAAHFVYAIICFARIGKEWMAVPDPYACDTPGCLAIAKTLNSTIKPTADPCTDFYEYACGSYVNMEQDPEATPDTPRLTHAFQSDTLNAYLSELLKLRGDKTDKAVDLYKSCIDEKSRLALGIDPLLKTMVKLLPTAFRDPSTLTRDLYEQQTSNIASTLGEFGAFRFHLRPNHKVALSRPDWVLFYGSVLRRILGTEKGRRSYEADVAKFFDKLWNRMKELKLIDERPFSGEEAAELLVIMLHTILHYVYNPSTPPDHRFEDLGKGQTDDFRKIYRELFAKLLGQDNFEVVNSEIQLERNAFGDWDGREGKPLGNFFVLRGKKLSDAMTVERRKPLPAEPSVINLQVDRGWSTLYIYIILHSYVNDLRPKTFYGWGLDKVFPNQFPQDVQRFVRIESYCMTSMVYHLNAFIRTRFYNFSDHEALRKSRIKIGQLSRNAKQSMRRWYTTQNDRSGHFDPFTHLITRQFFSVHNFIDVELPLPNLTDTFKASLERRLSYFDKWTVDHFNYLLTVVKKNQLINAGRLRDWQKNKLEVGDNNIMFLDYMYQSRGNTVKTKYQNTIGFPLLVMGPPYLNNDMRVLDYAGTGIYMTRSQLFLWFLNTLDPGPLRIPRESLAGLSQKLTSERKKEDCRAVNWQGLDDQVTSFSNYIKSSPGIHSLAIKLAYDLYKHPNYFEGLIDLDTGETFRPIRHKNGNFEFIAPHFYPNGTVVHWYFTKTANGMVTSKPVNEYRFVSPETIERYRLQYKKMLGMEQYDLDQLFFLHSAGDHCFSSHGSKTERYKRHKNLLNGIYRQVPEFGIAFQCSSNSFMNPSDSCFVDDEEVTLGLGLVSEENVDET